MSDINQEGKEGSVSPMDKGMRDQEMDRESYQDFDEQDEDNWNRSGSGRGLLRMIEVYFTLHDSFYLNRVPLPPPRSQSGPSHDAFSFPIAYSSGNSSVSLQPTRYWVQRMRYRFG